MVDKIKTIISAKDKGAGKVFGNLGGKVIALNQGLELANKALQALVTPFAGVVSEGREFGAQMSAVEAVTRANAQQMSLLTEEAKRLGSTTAFTAIQAGQAMEDLGRAGQSTGKIIETTGQALNLAAANSIELADAANLMAVQMNIFEKEGLSAQRAADLINQTIGSSPQNFEDFRYAMQYAAQTASSFNRDFAETTQIIGALAETGVRGSSAGTALSMAFARLAKPVPAAMDALKKYGITLDQINPEVNKFADIVDVLNKNAVTNSDLFTILGARTAPKFFKIIQKGGDSIRDFAEKQERANTALESADVRLNNLDGDITIFSSALSGLKLTVFESMDNILRGIVQQATSMVNAFEIFLKNNKGEVDVVFMAMGKALDYVKDGIVLVIRGLGHFIEAIGKIVGTAAFETTINNVIRSFKALQEIIVFVSPYLLSIAKLVGGILLDNMLTVGKIASTIVAAGFEALRDVILALPDAFDAVVKWIRNVISGFTWLFKTMLEIGTSVDDLLGSFVGLGKDGLLKAAKSFSEFTKESAKGLEQIGKVDYALTGNSLVPSFEALSEKLVASGKEMQQFSFEASKAKKVIKNLDKEISALEAGGRSVISVSGLQDTGIFSVIVKALSSGAVDVGNKIKNSFKESEISLGSVLSSIGSVFSKAVDAIWNLFTSNEKFKAALDRVFNTIGNVVAPVIEAFVPVLDALSKSIEEIAPFFKAVAKDLTPLVKDLIRFATDMSRATQPIIKILVERLVPLIQKIVEQIGPVLIQLTESLGPIISNLLDILIPIVEELLPIVVEILGLLAELNPLIAAVLEVIKPFVPIITALIRIVADVVRIIVNVLKPIIHLLVNVLKTVADVIQRIFSFLESVLRPLLDAIAGIFKTVVNVIKQLIETLKNTLTGGLPGGGGGGNNFGIPGLDKVGDFFGFQQGTGALTRDQLVRLPGMEPNAGLIKAHVGESVGQADTAPTQFIFNIKAIDPKATQDELRRLLEELRATGRL